MSLTKNFTLLYILGLIAGTIFMFVYANNQILTGDQMQMIYKGYLGAYENIWLQYGNSASAVGNVPGPLSAYVIGLPLLLWDNPFAPMLLIIILHIIAFFMLDNVIKKVFSNEIRLLFLLLYFLNPWFLFESLLYNPSYLFFFSALHLWSAFHMREKSSFIYSFLHLLSIGMAMQLHYSWIILAVISSYLFYRKMIQLNWLGILAAFALIIYSLIPYLQELLINTTLQGKNKEVDRYIGWGGVHVFPVFKAILYWFRYGSLLFTNWLVTGATFSWISDTQFIQTIAIYMYRAIVFTVGVLSIYISYRANRLAFNMIRPIFKRDNQKLTNENWLILYALGAFIAILVSATLSPIIFSYWHLISTFAFALIPILFFAREQQKSSYFNKIIYFVAIYFLFINIIASHDSKKYNYKANYEIDTLEYVKTHYPERINLKD